MMKYHVLLVVAVFLCTVVACAQVKPVVGEEPQAVEDRFVPEPGDLRVETWITGLEVPWAIAFLSPARALVTERPGRVRLIENGALVGEPYLVVDAENVGEGGLMGITAHPGYPDQPYIYIMYTYREGTTLYNKVERYEDRGRSAVFDRLIIERIPGARFHNGGRIAFGPDGLLYITAGENFQAELAQDLDSLGGKILRLTPDGEVPEDNPFDGSPIYTYGHRNPQGLAWHPETGDLFSSEHGPSGEFGLRGHDMVNVIRKGENYGWPRVIGEVNDPNYEDPLILWKQTTPPAGMAFWQGQLYLASLRARTLLRIELSHSGDGYEVQSIERLFNDGSESRYGRLRAVVVGPDGALYVGTSNRDGRGRPQEGDDRILRIRSR
jgi:quinoprotein glucose dehydrogenase